MIRKSLLGMIFFGLSLLFFIGLFHKVLPKSDARLTKEQFVSRQVQGLRLVAVGDSLTEGVGDTTGQGGFVPFLAKDLQDFHGYQVSSANYGVAGNTSKQILKRMKTDKRLVKSLKEADLLTLTVGGNDILAVIRKQFSNLTVSSFEKEIVPYQERLGLLIEEARRQNPDLPIYILGVYNPFYLNFPDLTDMQLVIDQWNQASQETLSAYEGVYFVPINDLLYKGVDGQGGTQTGQNDALFDEDHFHPNLTGYRLMANAVMEVIDETKMDWQH